MVDISTFEELESAVRSYCRTFPTVFAKAVGSTLIDQQGRRYLDFFSGAGALNYGHNHPRLKQCILDYLAADGVIHSLDMATTAKGKFLERFHEVILTPRQLAYKVQFCGPTGANTVEAALKLARKFTGRKTIVHFQGSFHGMTLGALSVVGDPSKRLRAGIPLDYTRQIPFESDPGGSEICNTLAQQWQAASKSELPAAVILETIQAEGGVRPASSAWLTQLADLLHRFGVLLIVDDIQVGCGRAGTFFSFEPAGIRPDLICLSKSISGFGLPMAVVLIRPELDVWQPGEHNGTFRGQNLAFVTGAEALGFWQDPAFAAALQTKAAIFDEVFTRWVQTFPELKPRALGRGLIRGLGFADPQTAGQVRRAAFALGLVIECAGADDEVLKFLPALTIEEDELRQGLAIVEEALADVRAAVPAAVSVA